MGRVIGIDLGTTNTAIAVLEDGRPRVLEDDKGYAVIPSCIATKGEGNYVVGYAAKNLILTHPDRTVYGVKRLLGQRFSSPAVQELKEHMTYGIREASDGGVEVQLGDEWMRPLEVSSIVLQVAREVAERTLEEAVDEAVITVPAYFTHSQRAATMEAARRAGLRCERLLNEPTAAAIAFGFRKDTEQNIVVFDLGGGTFDVSVLNLSKGVYEVLSTSGDTYLGGEDFDFRLLGMLAEHFEERTGIDLTTDATALQRLREAAERAKCALSFSEMTTVFIPQITANENLEIVLTRAQLEAEVDDLVDRCMSITLRAVADAGLQPEDVGEVVLVGGQSRAPVIRRRLEEAFGKAPSKGVHPEEVVAVGASIHAGSLEEPGSSDRLLIDVTPFDLGIDSAGGSFIPLLERNSKIPSARTRTFTTVIDNQESVRVVVRQGHSRRAAENELLGEFRLEGLRPAPRMEPKLDVTFRLDLSGMLHVTATDRATEERQKIVIRNYVESVAEGAQADVQHERNADEKIGEGPIERS
ncbi:MAG: Hsp70 family protein [Myxococcota bacterium]|nr:Hsp70 family protein [Myxococcota bacterium]